MQDILSPPLGKSGGETNIPPVLGITSFPASRPAGNSFTVVFSGGVLSGRILMAQRALDVRRIAGAKF